MTKSLEFKWGHSSCWLSSDIPVFRNTNAELPQTTLFSIENKVVLIFGNDKWNQTADLLDAMDLVRSTGWKYIHKIDELDYNIQKNNLLYSIWYNAFRDD